MKHICEICNQQYDTVEAAEQCELAHKKDDAAKKIRIDHHCDIGVLAVLSLICLVLWGIFGTWWLIHSYKKIEKR